MAQIDFNSIQTESNGNSVGFFSLKGDGDEAIVRFAHDSVQSFELITAHDISLNGKFRKANCIRDPKEPIENCPLCASGKKVQQRIFIHLIQYVQDENGNIVILPKVWDRPISYAYKLKSLMDEYGTLTESIFKIKRHGAAGSRETSYDILFCNPSMYDVNKYVKDFSAFDTYKALGSVVLDKSFDELLTYLNTGNFPEVKKEEHTNNYNNQQVNVVPNTIPNGSFIPQENNNYYQPQGNVVPQYQAQNTVINTQQPPVNPNPMMGQNNPMQSNMMNGGNNTFQNQQAIQRPVRSYN